ncbi:MAG: SRPBCC family protein [Bacteroidota bacterium]
MKTVNITFPEEYHPSKSAIHAHNELFIPASSNTIWYWLINATSWPEWYPNSANVEILNQENNSHLTENSKFNWRTFNTNIQSEVKEFEENKRLAWVANGSGLLAYHSWLIIEKDDGCLVVTEETQRGFLPRLFGFFIKKGLLKQHQIWLEGLRKKAIVQSV